MDNIRSTAASATHTVAASLDPSDDATLAQKTTASTNTDDQGTPLVKGSYKDQLNEAAHGNAPTPGKEETYVEKSMFILILQTINFMSTLLTHLSCLNCPRHCHSKASHFWTKSRNQRTEG
jgi:hypothetical protein